MAYIRTPEIVMTPIKKTLETNFDVFMLSGGGTDWNRRAPGAHWGLRAGERGVHLFFVRFSPSVYSEGIRTDVMFYPCFEV